MLNLSLSPFPLLSLSPPPLFLPSLPVTVISKITQEAPSLFCCFQSIYVYHYSVFIHCLQYQYPAAVCPPIHHYSPYIVYILLDTDSKCCSVCSYACHMTPLYRILSLFSKVFTTSDLSHMH